MFERSFTRYAASVAMAAAVWSPAPTAVTTDEEAEQILRAAKRVTTSIDGQALALAHLAWPSERPVDHRVAFAARDELAGFGQHALKALREALRTVDPLYRADVVAVLLEARRKVPTGMPADLLPAFEESMWYGSVEAQRLAMRELAQIEYERGVLPIIDAVYDHPGLLRPATLSLGRLMNVRARFFLDAVLRAEGDPLGDPRIRAAAAASLASFQGVATPVLRAACRSERPEVRQTAIAALVPITGLEDLTVLHEYIALHPDDDSAVMRLVAQRAQLLESLVDQLQRGEPVAPPDF